MTIKHNKLTRQQLEFYLGQSVKYLNLALKSNSIEEIKTIIRNVLGNIEEEE